MFQANRAFDTAVIGLISSNRKPNSLTIESDGTSGELKGCSSAQGHCKAYLSAPVVSVIQTTNKANSEINNARWTPLNRFRCMRSGGAHGFYTPSFSPCRSVCVSVTVWLLGAVI